ncbi:carboxypeptidase-like regulatory domain-containing protein [Symbioplanes lichenis]|uniref:carboxypeptidase-like regulatory domain-containing protein n=1 Tax=Symbioplanes lichenis TaxID=1629072 RepID=UPI0027386AD4|nr:carboxypeptidase-like regulatory domain-containing protein [Actinoplanes lichenis]
MRARGFVLNRDTGEPLAGVNVVVTAGANGDSRPVSLLTTDDAGYVSFDLDGAGAGPVSLEVVGQPGTAARLPEAGTAGGTPDGAVVLRADPARLDRVPRAARRGIPSPDGRDWELSPASFVTPRTLALGEDDCTVPVRSALPLQQISFFQVVRKPVAGPGVQVAEIDPPRILDLIGPVSAVTPAPVALPCDILEYEQTWQDIGESLGTILYSLPLAPCESVKIAVIEAERSDQAARTDAVTAGESLDHSLFRDRSIAETVKGVLRESQGGSSFMAGHAGAYSGSWANVGNFGATHSLGFATTNSWGKRQLKAESAQDLHDTTIQATDVVRTLNSTVIVQGTQAERHRLETRTVTNHNHCHALTVQYYEVLRRLKLTTRYVRTRPGVLIPYAMLVLTKPYPTVSVHDDQMGHPFKVVDDPERGDLHLVNRLRPMLEGALVTPALDAGFEAVRRLLFYDTAAAPPPATTTPDAGGDYEFTRLNVTLTRGRWGTDTDVVSLKVRLAGLHAGDIRYALFSGERLTDRIVLKSSELWGDDEDLDAEPKAIGPFKLKLNSPARRSHVAECELHFDPGRGGSDFSLRGFRVAALRPDGQEDVLVEEAVDRYFDGAGVEPFDIRALPAAPAATEPAAADPAVAAAQRRGTDVSLAWELITHLHEHRDLYGPRLVAMMEPMWFAQALDQAFGLDSPREDIDSRPLAVSGQYLLFAYRGDEAGPAGPEPAAQPEPTVVSLPTRGMMAEAQLGTCNACEKRDVTRFWDWQESPCEQAPAIEGVSPGFRGQAPDVTPATLPPAVVQISQPPTAPDPVGLAAALTLLGKGDAFRDMAGTTELRQLLSGLASGAIDLAKAKELAKEVQNKQAAAPATAAPAAPAAPRTPAERYDEHQVLRADVDAGTLTPEDARRIVLAGWWRDRSPEPAGPGAGADDPTLESIRAKVESLIKGGHALGMHTAADNLEHWYRGGGVPRLMPSDVLVKEPTVARHLRISHLARFARGAEERLRSGTLQVGGTARMTWHDLYVSPGLTELFWALGSFQLQSEVTVGAHAVPGDPAAVLIRVGAWRVHGWDEYNFDATKAAFVQGYGDIQDAELDRLRAAGIAHDYAVTVLPFDGLTVLGAQEFAVPK